MGSFIERKSDSGCAVLGRLTGDGPDYALTVPGFGLAEVDRGRLMGACSCLEASPEVAEALDNLAPLTSYPTAVPTYSSTRYRQSLTFWPPLGSERSASSPTRGSARLPACSGHDGSEA